MWRNARQDRPWDSSDRTTAVMSVAVKSTPLKSNGTFMVLASA